ncbi:MAG TPA: type II secretion system protein N [Casimicrobiaceae bacterium]|nr:type II secretion system protein N [Casimicrobiaceae bacterium]
MRIAGGVAAFAALGLLALTLAYWGWQVMAPARVHIPATTPADPAAALLASGLWAGPSTSAAAATGTDTAPQVLGGDVRLLGVFAEPNGRGYALFRMASGPRLVAAGQEIAAGATLAEVRPDGIRVREAGGERSIELRSMAARPISGAANPSSSKVAVGTTRSACAPPPGFKGDVIVLNAELMGGLIAQPESWRALVEPANGALVVRDDSGFSAMLGLKRGDRIAQANGIALTAADDVIGAVLRPLAAKQTVRIAGSRDGHARELWLRNVTC